MRATFLFVITVLLHASSLHATDLLVAVGGSGNVYPTITAAHAAAVENDRILVQPGTYNETVTITKSVEIVSNSPTQRFTVNGSLAFNPSGGARTTTIIGMYLTGGVTDNGPSASSGSTLRLIDCRVNNVFSFTGAIRYVLMADSVLAGVIFEKGDVFGSWVRADASTGVAIQHAGISSGSVANRIIGNEIVTHPSNSNTLIQVTPIAPFRVENNLIRPGTLGGALYVSNISGAVTTQPSTFANNTTIRPSGSSWTLVSVAETDPALLLDLRNNFTLSPVVPTLNSAGTTTSQSFNVHTTNLSYANAIGALTPGAPAINAGDPDASYTDLDLSRNDAGCYGGSYSRDNFDDPVPTSAIVAFMNAPRRTLAGQSMSVTIDAFDR